MFNRMLVAVAVMLVAKSLAAVAQAPQSGWVADPRTGCKVWSFVTAPQFTVTWSGACANGLAQGRGVVQWFVNGRPADRSEGDYRDGKRYGLGTNIWPNGDRYRGEYRDGLRNGHGVFTYSDGRQYDGEFRDGLPNGRGVFSTPKTVFIGNWTDGCYREGDHRAAVGRDLSTCP